MDRENARQQIRSSWRQILATMTQPARQKMNGETSYICPLCGHGTHGDGITVNPRSADGNGLKCFGCGFSGDIIDLYQQANGVDYNDAFSLLANSMHIAIDAASTAPAPTAERKQSPQPPKAAAPVQTADFTLYYADCMERLNDPAALSYLSSRGISTETAKRYGIGFDPAADPASAPGASADEHKPHPVPRIIIPISAGHYIGRSVDPETPKGFAKLNNKGADIALFNDSVLYKQEAQEVYITEGIFNALSILEAGAEAIATNSANNADKLLKQLEERPTIATLILCFDNDNAGHNATDKMRQGLQRLKVNFIDAAAEICGAYNDANEAMKADKEKFIKTVQETKATARETIARQKQEAQKAALEERQRIGSNMVNAFLDTVRTRKYEPIPTGITDIDAAIGGGFMRQQIILLGAAPGAGKTALAQWIFEGMAKRGQPCLYLNLEMSREQMLSRSLSRIAAQQGNTIKPTDIMQGYKWEWTQEAVILSAAERYKKEIAPNMIYNPESVKADLDSIIEYITAEAERAAAAGFPTPCVILDYLQIVKGRPGEEEAALIKRAMDSLKTFAMKYNTFIFVIMANNRASNRTGNVTMESGRDSSALEYGADLQLGLAYTLCLGKSGKDKDDLTPEEKRQITLKITKNRWGKSDTEVNLIFNGEEMTYTQTTSKYDEVYKNYNSNGWKSDKRR